MKFDLSLPKLSNRLFVNTSSCLNFKISNMKNRTLLLSFCCSMVFICSAQKKVFPGADEKSPSQSQYSSWLNHTNEGATEKQTLTNLSFFKWMQDEYGMKLAIYAMDAGVIDGKNFYGSTDSKRFREKFPAHFDNIYTAAKQINTRLGIWGGPDGFGTTPEEAKARKTELVNLCKKYEWALFKFDAVCGPLRPEKEDDFIQMMEECRSYSPDLILLNHRLGLNKGKPYATTFLWGGQETYIDVFTSNTTTAPHNRAGALERGLVPNLQRLTEDCGVCISSCLDYWEDDLILQAFNRSLILAPEVYGNPWLLNDNEFWQLARIYNLHHNYASILVNGVVLSEKYGPYPVSRGDDNTRLLTLRNLSWEPKNYTVILNEEIGLKSGDRITVKQYHPTEKILGTFIYGEKIAVSVPAYRSLLLMATNQKVGEAGVKGVDYQVVKEMKGQPIEIKLLGMPGTKAIVSLPEGLKYKTATIDGKSYPAFAKGSSMKIAFEGTRLKLPYHRRIASLQPVSVPADAEALYESTVFAADNNALEVRSLLRSGETKFDAVKKARDAFFSQKAFINRGLWDKYLFDGDMKTGFWPSNKYGVDQRVQDGCFRFDLGEVRTIDKIVLKLTDEHALEPLLVEEGAFAEVSTDLVNWERITYITGLEMQIVLNRPFRYLRMSQFPNAIAELEVYSEGKKLDSKLFRASNLFASSKVMKCIGAWKADFQLAELAANSYLCVAINGKHGEEGAYAALKVDGKYIGAPTRSVSYPSNTWEYVNARKASNYTYYFPMNASMIGKKIEVFAMGYQAQNLVLNPEVWITAYPLPFAEKTLLLTQ